MSNGGYIHRYICTHACMCVCVCMHLCVYVHMYSCIHTCLCSHVCVYIHNIYTYIYIYIYACVCVTMCTCFGFVCMYVQTMVCTKSCVFMCLWVCVCKLRYVQNRVYFCVCEYVCVNHGTYTHRHVGLVQHVHVLEGTLYCTPHRPRSCIGHSTRALKHSWRAAAQARAASESASGQWVAMWLHVSRLCVYMSYKETHAHKQALMALVEA